jgi:hypothetical protein
MTFVFFVTDSYWLACDTSVDSSGFGDDDDLEMCAGMI